MAYSSYLRDKAVQALRTAQDNTDPVLVKTLMEDAAEYLGRAEAIDLVESLREVAAALGKDPENN
jgi:hypothetical protein